VISVTARGRGRGTPQDRRCAMAGDAAVIANQARSEMTLTNGGAFQAANLYLGNIAGTGTLNVFSAGQVTLTGALIAGSSSGPTGIVNVDGTSSLVTSNGATIGSGGIGIVNLTNGGTFNAGTTMVVGSTAGSSGSLTIQNGGTTDFGGAVGDSAGSQGTATVGAPSLISLSPSSTGRRSAKPSDLRQRRCARLLTASTTIRQSGWGWTACKAQGDARTPRELHDVIIRVARGAASAALFYAGCDAYHGATSSRPGRIVRRTASCGGGGSTSSASSLRGSASTFTRAMSESSEEARLFPHEQNGRISDPSPYHGPASHLDWRRTGGPRIGVAHQNQADVRQRANL
jgi:hypothetical protein